MRYLDAKSILSGYAAENRWFGLNYNMNLYRGCTHGCIYCDSRSECYRNPDFDHVYAKRDALTILKRELAARRKPGVVGTGAMSDPYNPHEAELFLTRGALALIADAGFGIAIMTKSDLVVRDIDVLRRIARQAPAMVMITVTCADDALCRIIEPNAPSPSRRFAAIHELSRAGILCGVLMMPILPFITDSWEQVADVVHAAAAAGARFIYPGFGVTLRGNQRAYFYEKLDAYFPGKSARYRMSFHDAYACNSPHSRALATRFAALCRKRGLISRMDDIIALYRAPYEDGQLTFEL